VDKDGQVYQALDGQEGRGGDAAQKKKMQSQRGPGEGLNNQGAAAAGKRDADGQGSAQEARRSTQKGTDDSLQMYQKK